MTHQTAQQNRIDNTVYDCHIKGSTGIGSYTGIARQYLLALPTALLAHLHLPRPPQRNLILSVHIPAGHASAATALHSSSSSTRLCSGMLAAASQLPAGELLQNILYNHIC